MSPSSSGSSAASPGDLVRRYFVQLTEGCGWRGCPNRYCLSCVDGPGQLDRTAAALRALELAQGGSPLHLCEEQPPFMHLEMLRGLIADATRTGEWRRLEKEVSGVFSNANALNRSFLQRTRSGDGRGAVGRGIRGNVRIGYGRGGRDVASCSACNPRRSSPPS